MDDAARRKVLGLAAVTTVCVLLGWGGCRVAGGAEVAGPKRIDAGRLATFKSSTEGDFAIYPNASSCFAKDSNRKILYFASPKVGDYTLIFFGLENGLPVISTMDFAVGNGDPDPVPSPEPEPMVTLTGQEKDALRWAIESVLGHIEKGSLRTTQGVRATFKQALLARLGTVSEGLNKELARWTENIDFSSVENTKKGLHKILEELL